LEDEIIIIGHRRQNFSIDTYWIRGVGEISLRDMDGLEFDALIIGNRSDSMDLSVLFDFITSIRDDFSILGRKNLV
jgi:hypothetical protein